MDFDINAGIHIRHLRSPCGHLLIQNYNLLHNNKLYHRFLPFVSILHRENQWHRVQPEYEKLLCLLYMILERINIQNINLIKLCLFLFSYRSLSWTRTSTCSFSAPILYPFWAPFRPILPGVTWIFRTRHIPDIPYPRWIIISDVSTNLYCLDKILHEHSLEEKIPSNYSWYIID